MAKVLSRIPRPVYLYLLGLAASLPLLFDALGVLIFISYIPALYMMLHIFMSRSFRDGKHPYVKAYLYGLALFGGFYMGVWSFFPAMYPLDFAGLDTAGSIGVILIAWLGLPLVQSIFFAPIFPLFHLLRSKRLHKLQTPTVFASLFALFDFMQTLTWAGVPWGVPASALYRLPIFLQSASLFGAAFVSFLIILVNSYLAMALISFRERYDMERARSFAIIALAIFSANLILGTAMYLIPKDNSENSLKVAVLQANVSSRDKWESTGSSYQAYMSMAENVLVKEAPDLLIMPETAFVLSLSKNGYYSRSVKSLAVEHGATIIVGAFSTERDGEDYREYTSLFIFYPDGTVSDTVYSKQKLVPFGEYLPWAPLISAVAPPLAELCLSFNDLSRGEGSQLFDSEYGKIGSMICFDTVYPRVARKSVSDGASLLVVSTNDSWFGSSRAMQQHHSHSVLRAIENGRYVCVSANTGISGVIAPNGKVICESEVLTEAYLTATVHPRTQRTLYSHIGELPVLTAFIYVIYTALDGKINCCVSRLLGRKKKTLAKPSNT